MRYVCQKCGGENPYSCRDPGCPIKGSFAKLHRSKEMSSSDFSSSSYSVFVGRYGYPKVNVGLLAPPARIDESWVCDAPSYWQQAEFGIDQVVDLRGSLINSRFQSVVKRPASKELALTQEVACARLPVDVEVALSKVPQFHLRTHKVAAPMGPGVGLVKARLTENPKIPRLVGKAVSDTDLKSAPALVSLYNRSIDENALSKILSVGNLGIGKNRRLVPTRWSITATDDTLGKSLIKEVKDFQQGGFHLYYGNYLGNHFFVLCFADVWRYELFETYVGGRDIGFTTDFEDYRGRKGYAEECAGGYYASRLAVLEGLRNQKRQCSALVLRFIDDTYTTPLGVWVVREAVRRAMQSKPLPFDSKESLLQHVRLHVTSQFGYPCDTLLDSSKLLTCLAQKKLFEF